MAKEAWRSFYPQKVQHRLFAIDGAKNIDTEERTVEVAFSSNTPLERSFGEEILEHEASSARLSRLNNGASVLVNHREEDHVGVVQRGTARIDSDGKGRATLRFGQSVRASEIFTDVTDGIRQLVSVGFVIRKAVQERIENGLSRVRITDWEPFEISLASVADDALVAGVGRIAEEYQEENKMPEVAEKTEVEEKPEAVQKRTQEKPDIRVDLIQERQQSHEAGQKAERERVDRLTKIADKYGKAMSVETRDLLANAVRDGNTVEEFGNLIVERASNVDRPLTTDNPNALDLTNKEVKEYSLYRAIGAALTNKWDDAGFELECSVAIQERSKKQPKGFFVPLDVQYRSSWGDFGSVQTREMQKQTPALGGTFVGTDHLGANWVDNLRARSVILQLGPTILSNLVGDIDIPRKTSSATFQWSDDDTDAILTDLATDTILMAPSELKGGVAMRRKILKQSDPSVEAMTRADIVRGMALAIDLASINGSGVGEEPTGILNTTGVPTVPLAADGNPTYDETVDFETTIDSGDALQGRLAYVTGPQTVGNMRKQRVDPGSGEFLMDRVTGTVNGYTVARTSQMPVDGAGPGQRTIFGNWEDHIMAMWGTLDIMPDQFALAARAALVIRVFQDIDLNVRHPESFAIDV